ncbi:MAG TPA: RsmD family RNA methyltransferase, partial [Phnomibacter sp.]|nr:RsmD family RNA methyltransferase [Phnomibacter sp.]
LTIVEKDPAMHKFIATQLVKLHLPQVQLIKMDVFKFLETCRQQYDFIFAGPPYALQQIDDLPRMVVGQQLIAPDGLFVLEHTPRNQYQQFDGFVKVRNYGTTVFSFFEAVPPS